jgi:hypothetical protein
VTTPVRLFVAAALAAVAVSLTFAETPGLSPGTPGVSACPQTPRCESRALRSHEDASYGRAMSRASVAAVAIVIAATAASSAGAHADSTAEAYTIFPEAARLGSFSLTNGTIRTAARFFGPPTSLESYRLNPTQIGAQGQPRCAARWGRKRLKLHFRGPCDQPAQSTCPIAVMSGGAWRTSRGLKIGDPMSKLYELYPDARPRAGVRVPSAWRTLGGREYPPFYRVGVRFVRGRVSAFSAASWVSVSSTC